jgi:hypothetical protein
MDQAPSTRPRASNWWKWLLGCGCALALLSAVAVVGAGWWAARKVGQSLVLGPQKVEALAAEILPGAVPPPGHQGLFGMRLAGIDMAFLAPVGFRQQQLAPGQLMIMMMAFPPGAQVSQEEAERQLREALAQQGQGKGGGKVVSQETVTLTIGGRPVPAVKTVLQDDQGGRSLCFTALVHNPAQRLVCLLIQGPEASFNRQAMQAFLAPLRLQAAAGSPAPAPGK